MPRVGNREIHRSGYRIEGLFRLVCSSDIRGEPCTPTPLTADRAENMADKSDEQSTFLKGLKSSFPPTKWYQENSCKGFEDIIRQAPHLAAGYRGVKK